MIEQTTVGDCGDLYLVGGVELWEALRAWFARFCLSAFLRRDVFVVRVGVGVGRVLVLV